MADLVRKAIHQIWNFIGNGRKHSVTIPLYPNRQNALVTSNPIFDDEAILF